MSTQAIKRNNPTPRSSLSTARKSVPPSENGNNNGIQTRPSSPPQLHVVGERTVKKLRLSKSLTISEATTVSDASRRMASRHVDAALLIDANGLLSGIITDKDISTRVIAERLKPQQTIVSKVMTRNPVFVQSDSLAIEALQKMILGKFRHLPVVENGDVIAVLDITKCLYDAISRMEKAAEQGSAIAAAVEGVEHEWGDSFSAPSAFTEILRERMFKPSLSTIISENSKVAIVAPSDTVYFATRKMRELNVTSVIVANGNRPLGILTSRDVLRRMVARNLSPDLTLVEKVMTSNPEYAKLETTLLEALHIMHEGNFLHLPVLDKYGSIAACMDVLQITHAAISTVEGSSGTLDDMASSMMQKFLSSAIASGSEPPDECDTYSEFSVPPMPSEGTEASNFINPTLRHGVGHGDYFAFKFQDHKGHAHRFNCGTEHLDELVSAVMQRIGTVDVQNHPIFFYVDDEGDKVLLLNDSDLVGAVSQARQAGLKVLRLHLEYYESSEQPGPSTVDMKTVQKTEGLTNLQSGLLAGSAALASIGLLAYLNRSNQ